ncbi:MULTISPECIES: tetratricopeptide repeat protein [Variovorax]|jgi:tetratricopeptide (TPR) repeat protein|uniref:tetratricopeptide repeat protein n=1 Tax=Variovorax TaxID=34072 RepID=UPI00086AC615|nr:MULTISPECIES: tetratricopeptide repeat protein [Variovorax]MBN8758292.1 hypothetical protein [Variovorax sp.]ODU12687.1 MAG: hypothetical protein ABS94_29940 [Variovorax sp. SCN 67-85]ODV19272.1 MAG: hypothetical protein ABT25_26830 [Variovorax sp. SCN 67-20]OJZ06582.1 MAG: hypothetical protein BGP22_31160 [Variovorax sp. 67-131]UKI07612.1 hypothetical protein L3V85_33255 [Variovorax paradoxus]
MTQTDTLTFDAWISNGMTASQANDSLRAIECFQNASDAAPEAGLPQFLLGAEFATLGDMARAETAFANAARLAPDFPMARYQLGLLQFSSGRAATALLTWEPLLALPESNPLPHFIHGFTALAQDRFQEALKHYDQGLALNTTNDALSSDIAKIVERIRALQDTSVTEHESADSEGNHVLLANYQQQGPMH